MFKRFVSDSEQVAHTTLRKAVLLVGTLFWLTGWSIALTLGEVGSLRSVLCWSAGPVAWLAMLIGRSVAWRWGAWALMLGWFSVLALLGLSAGFSVAAVLLNFVTMVAFAGWTLGLNVAVGWAVVCVALAVLMQVRGLIQWQETLPLTHSLALMLWVLLEVHRHARRQINEVRQSLQLVQAKSEQLMLLSRAVDQIPESMAVVDFDGHLLYVNQAFERQTGYRRADVLGMRAAEVSINSLSDAQRQQMREIVEQGQVWTSVLHNRRSDGQVVIESVSIAPVHNSDGKMTHFIEIKQDMKERLENERRIDRLQNLDEVTQLPNLTALLRRIDTMLMQQGVLKPEVAGHALRWHGLVLLEMDRFGDLQDAKGIAAGEELRQAMARRIQSFLPENAWMANPLAERFAVLYEYVGRNPLHARRSLNNLAFELQNSVHEMAKGRSDSDGEATADWQQLSCSIGFTAFAIDDEHVQSGGAAHVLRCARVALKQAKTLGGGRIQAYTDDLAESVRRKTEIENALYIALQPPLSSATPSQLQLYVQPQTDWAERVLSVEALVRWNHPEHGWISPAEFVPLAEGAGLIVELGDWVLAQVCQLLRMPQVEDGGYGVSANVSALQLAQPDFVDKLRALVQSSGINPEKLTLEITESAMLDDVQAVLQKMEAIQALGVQLALDDFGTGYSSLSYLQQLPIHEIKMDQSFIRNLDPQGVSGAVVEAVLMVANRKGLRVIAEGVEEQEQAELLRAWEPGVLCQGYWISRPLPLAQWLEDTQLKKRLDALANG